jgi:uncharacterized phiE125 gp8 family phage protein
MGVYYNQIGVLSPYGGGLPLPLPHPVSVLTTPPTGEPLTIDEGKLLAGFEWPAGDPREPLMRGWIQTARAVVERDTGTGLLTQTRTLWLDSLPLPFTLPPPAKPLQAVTITATDLTSTEQIIDPSLYVVDLAGGRIGLGPTGFAGWPQTTLRGFQPWRLELVLGYPDVATLEATEPLLLSLVRLLTAHLATMGRDVVTPDQVVEMPFTYTALLESYLPLTLM